MIATAPFNFFAQALVANGNTAIPDLDALVSTIRAPVVVDEIWFAVRSWTAATRYDLSGQVSVDLALGAWRITDRPVPVGLLGPLPLLGPASLYSAGTPVVADTALLSVSRRWRLPRPMFMTPDDRLSVVFSRDTSALYTDPVMVKMSVVGRYVAEPDHERSVPYVSSWVPALGSETWLASPAPEALHNRLSKPVQVKGFQFIQRSDALMGSYTDSGGNIQIARSFSNATFEVTQRPTRIFDLAGGDGSVPVRAKLAPGEGYFVTWEANGSSLKPGVALFGWREEPLS